MTSLEELIRICRGAEHDAQYATGKLDGHPMQHNVLVLQATFKFIRENLEALKDETHRCK